MIVKTADGVSFEADEPRFGKNPKQMFLNMKNVTILEAANIICPEGKLPLQGYEEYTVISALSNHNDDVMAVLKLAEE